MKLLITLLLTVPLFASYQGLVESATCSSVSGWALEAFSNPPTVLPTILSVDVFDNGVDIGTAPANQPNKGGHGFAYKLGFTSGVHMIEIRYSGYPRSTPIAPASFLTCGGPVVTPPVTPPVTPVTPPVTPPAGTPCACVDGKPGAQGPVGPVGPAGPPGRDGKDATGGGAITGNVADIKPGAGIVTVSEGSTLMIYTDDNLVGLRVKPPKTVSDPCTVGSWAMDPNFFYLCVAPNTWRGAKLTTF